MQSPAFAENRQRIWKMRAAHTIGDHFLRKVLGARRPSLSGFSTIPSRVPLTNQALSRLFYAKCSNDHNQDFLPYAEHQLVCASAQASGKWLETGRTQRY